MTYDELPLFRATDPATSRTAAADVRIRLASQQHQLLTAYGHPSANLGLTADEAGIYTGLAARRGCCYWKRCSELRHAGFIEDTGRTRTGMAGSEQMVCVITERGLAELGRLRMDEARRAG